MRHYELAHLIAFAMHEPKNMPKFSGAADAATEERAEVSDEIAQAQVRGWFIAMAKKSGA